MPGMESKRCTACGEVKGLGEFYKHKGAPDGLHYQCKQCAYERNLLWRKANPEKVAASDRRWREANPEKEAEYQLLWREANPEKRAEQKRKRRASKLNAPGGGFTNAQFNELCTQAGGRCLACGEIHPLTADHIVPLSKGGRDAIDNIQPLCRTCNSSKGTKATDYRHAIIDHR